MNTNELRDHFRETAKSGKLADHLRTEHGISNPPTTRQAQDRLHKTVHEAATQEASREASVLAGVTRKPEEAETTAKAKAPASRTRKTAPAKATTPARKPATTKTTTRKPAPAAKPAPAKAPAKTTARKPATTTTAKANGTGEAKTFGKQVLARTLVDLVAKEFKDASEADKLKLSYWLHGLPTGGPDGSPAGGGARYWPDSLPRPTTADWR
jgi:hypothetical protein